MSRELSYKYILKFWMPLAATWLMMSIEGPFLSAIIARMPNPKYNLAAYGVAFAVALIIEAPVIMMMSASTALVKSQRSFLKLRSFSYTINFSTTLLMLVLLIPPIFNFFALEIMNLETKVADLTYWAVLLLIPWPGAIGYRRFYQGILIKNNETRKVAYGTIIRLISMSSTAIVLFISLKIDGVLIGASALSAGVIMEAASSKFMAGAALKKLRSIESADNEILSYKGILSFYYPLALTSLLGLGVHPMVTFFMGQSRMPLESLAVLPVVNSLVFIFRSIGLSLQEVIIALAGEHNEGIGKLKKFSFYAGISVLTALSLIAFTPMSHLWFRVISGLSPELSHFAVPAVRILALLPALTVLISFQRSILVHTRNTKPITFATAVEVSGIILVMFLLITYFNATGIIAAAAAYLLGRIGANLYLTKPMLTAMKKI